MGKKLFTSESVTEGHPDKVCDQISDTLLDEFLKQDPESKAAIETVVSTGLVVIVGEVTSKGSVNVEDVVRRTIKEIGYDNSTDGFDYNTCKVLVSLHEQSPDISIGVLPSENKEQGAGDQGLMFGYATDETAELMPMTINVAHKLTMRLSEVRKKKEVSWVKPDGKSQVTVEYDNDKPKRIHTVVVSTHHSKDVENETIRKEIMSRVIEPICNELIDKDTIYHINPTGRFIVGGPAADSGLTGRKLIADAYGGIGSHGGGAFSGKDPSKVDRSGSYMARYVAKNIIASGLAHKCQLQIAYVIGIAEPVSLMVNTLGTNAIPEETIEEIINKNFDLRPAHIIKNLNLKRPIFSKTSNYGHFGRNDPDFTWEKTDKIELLKR
ncbi:MAG: methionine adenosyltransferase [Thaumarchaeota archaeon]|nr:methionine adenosyltransferase [Nitrososphaerota archaeon]